MSKSILISEIFGPTIQGEGSLVGVPTVFVRTGGCDFRCSWCDTLYAVLPEHREEWRRMDAEEILAEVRCLCGGPPILVTLSGGNPALQPLGELLARGRDEGFRFALETQASVAKAWFSLLDYLILSPKGPSSGMVSKVEQVSECLIAAGEKPTTCLKFVIFDESDYLFAQNLADAFPGVPVYLQCGTSSPTPPGQTQLIDEAARRIEWLLGRVTRDGWREVRILPQLHTLLWGNKRGK